MATLVPKLTSTPTSPPTYNVGMAETFSWVPVEGAGRPLFARASYIANFEDLSVSLSAAELHISSISLKDGNSNRVADVEDAGGGLNALRVLTQDLESTNDSITIGDRSGSFAAVNSSLSALRILEVAPVTAVSILNPVTAVNVSGSVSLTNPVTALNILNTVAVSGSITVSNPVSSVSITNPVTSINVTNTVAVSGSVTMTNPTTGVYVLNPVALKDANDNNVTVVPSTSSLNVNVTNPLSVSIAGTSGNTDAFGRLRTSTPLTLFDSAHRYEDNGLWASLTAVGGTYSFNSNQGLIDMTVGTLSGSSVIRETTKVFSYQSGKGLLVMSTFVMAPSSTNLRQRVGYFGKDNGFYLQLDGSSLSLVRRSTVGGSIASETIEPKASWNIDKLDGTGPSGLTLDITKAQILWMDFEWLGVGTVRMGFVINGQFITCHSFHHANLIPSTYIATASLPLRYEITNKDTTASSSTLKQICSTIISEGGYELRGAQQAVGTLITAPRDLTDAGTFYPVITIRLKSNRLDAIVILSALSILGVTNNVNYNWRLLGGSTTTGGAGWVSAGDNSSVEYRLDATAVSGGRVLASGFTQGSNQGATSVDLPKEALFKFQLERNSLTSTPYEITLAAAAGTAGGDMLASMDWEEVSR